MTNAGDDNFEEFVQRNARGYNEPLTVPREEMWTAIGAARAELRRRALARRRFVQVAVGMAATLVIGVAVGRYAFRSPDQPTVTSARSGQPSATAYDVATRENLNRAEMLLVAYVNPTTTPPADTLFTQWARDVLSNTRLLLDSPAGIDPVRHKLLTDLEHVLVQMVQKSPAESDAEVRTFVERTISHTDMMTRLRATQAQASNGGS